MGCSPAMCCCFVRCVFRFGFGFIFIFIFVRGTHNSLARPANPSYTEDELSASVSPHTHSMHPFRSRDTDVMGRPRILPPPQTPRSLPDPNRRCQITPHVRGLPADRARRRGEDGHPAHADRRVRRPEPATRRGARAVRHRRGADPRGVDEPPRVCGAAPLAGRGHVQGCVFVL